MLKIIAVLALLGSVSAFANCDDLYRLRQTNLKSALKAYQCYSTTAVTTNAEKAHSLARMSYLKFTIAEFFLKQKEKTLLEALTLGERAVLVFGPKYSLEAYSKLTSDELDELAFALYSYGLSLSRYVDIKGKLEAIRRMEDIKKSMNTILRIKRESTAFYGALRTLGIFHLKVPAIAGGQLQLSRPYLERAIRGSLYRGSLSRYPGNNLALAEVLFKLGDADRACSELKNLSTLTVADIQAMANGFSLESLADLRNAKALAIQKKCI